MILANPADGTGTDYFQGVQSWTLLGDQILTTNFLEIDDTEGHGRTYLWTPGNVGDADPTTQFDPSFSNIIATADTDDWGAGSYNGALVRAGNQVLAAGNNGIWVITFNDDGTYASDTVYELDLTNINYFLDSDERPDFEALRNDGITAATLVSLGAAITDLVTTPETSAAAAYGGLVIAPSEE